MARADREALGKDAGKLATADQYVVGPFQVGGQPRRRGDAFTNTDTGREC